MYPLLTPSGIVILGQLSHTSGSDVENEWQEREKEREREREL